MRHWLAIGAVNGFLAVLAGAVGAHLVAVSAGANLAALFGQAASYHLVHALALIAAASAPSIGANRKLSQASCILFAAGIVLFCFSLYARAATGNHIVTAAAPFGGVALMLGWLVLAAAAWSRGRPES